MRGGVVRRGSTWTYVVRERDRATGQSRARWVGGFRTRGEAVQARAAAVAAQARGTYVAPSRVTVGQWLDTWLAGHAVELKPSAAASYRGVIDRYLVPTLGGERLQRLTPSVLSAVFRELSATGGHGGKPLSARTVQFARAVLRRALNDAIVERLIEVNPVTGSKTARPVKPQHQTWDASQLAAFLAHDHERFTALFAVSAATGMRRGEVLALRWDDVDLDRRLVHVARSVTLVNGVLIYGTPKNHERRDVQIDATATAALRAWRVQQTRERLAATQWADETGLVFTTPDGTLLRPDEASRQFQRAQTTVTGLPRLKLHELRHTHATLLLRGGVPVHVVAKRLGHKDPSVTLNVYADAVPDDDGRAVDAFAKAVHGA